LMQVGIVGLPNVGKSTLFNALTKGDAEVKDYPFTTIDRNVGIADVPDARLEELAELVKPEKLTWASIQYVDIAGLVKGSSKGEGLGNRFLAHIREVDCILHVLRGFRKGDVAHVDGSVDPLRDAEVIATELALADLESLEPRIEKAEKAAKGHDKDAVSALSSLVGARELLDSGSGLRGMESAPPGLLSTKPILYVLNMDESDIASRSFEELEKVKAYAGERSAGVCAVSARSELELAEIEKKEREMLRRELGLNGFGLEELVLESFRLLDLITFYTIKGTETRSWHLPSGSTAGHAAGKIHTDMEEGFIKAEVVSFFELERAGSMQEVRASGLLRTEGREYIVQDGDVILIKFRA
jgi:GTP-binding protein YchF